MTARSWSDLLSALVAGQDLAVDESAWAMEEILAGSATPSQIAGFAVALRAKGESVDELAGLVATMYAHAETIDVDGRVVDIVGTGGDRAKTVNISTMSAVAMAGAGVPVVKHGGRAASSASGAADVLEELGVRLDVPVDRVPEIAEQIGITFCFAPVFHSSLRFAAVPRRELGIATTFNLLGPLANPARPGAMAVGVADRQIAPVMAGVLARRDVDALVFRGDDGLDEITTTTTSTIWVVGGAEGARSVTERSLDPRELGIEFSAPEALRGGDAAYNASVFRRVLDGEHGPVRDAVVLNAAAGLCAHEAAEDDLLERLRRNAERVRSAIDSGDAARLLNRWIETTAAIVAP